MSLSKKDVSHIAKLARMEITPDEESKFSEELEIILEYIGQLNQADVKNISPLYQTANIVNSVREDIPNGIDTNLEELISVAPDSKRGYVKVRPVLKK